MWRLLRQFATKRVLLTGVGKERLGLLTDLSGIIFSEEGNIQESCMSKLAGDFALMMLLELPEERLASLQLKLMRNLPNLNLAIRDVHEEPHKDFTGSYVVKMTLKGRDFPGIMHHFSNFLSFSGINILNLTTHFPSNSHEIFSLRSRLQVPQLIQFSDLQDKICAMAEKEGLKVTMQQLADELD